MDYFAPEFRKDKFHCPHCDVLAHQVWSQLRFNVGGLRGSGNLNEVPNLVASHCERCYFYALWMKEKLIWPNVAGAPFPNPDMPDDVKEIYEEARSIVNASPRGAAAMLRLAIQVLMPHLEEEGKNLNKDIGNLVKKGLLPGVSKALDAVRVIGNESVHPGQLDLKDDRDTVRVLFHLINTIIDQMISRQNAVDEIYKMLPEEKKAQIERRDSNQEPPASSE